jgi:hypothetical protein
MDNLPGMPEPVETDSNMHNGELLEKWVYRCLNGYGISVVLGENGPHISYASRRRGLYEVAAIKFTGDNWRLSRLPGVTEGWSDDPAQPWQTLAQVQDIYRQVAAQPG